MIGKSDLKDKNGNLIYEGAIVKFVDDDGAAHYSAVEYELGEFYAFSQTEYELTPELAAECEIVEKEGD